MADNKKYYYMRLKENFFDSEEIKVLEAMPNGYKYSNILLKLYLKSLKSNGELRLNEYIPYDANMIAAITGHDVDAVRTSLDVFKRLKLIEILDNGTIYMLGIQSYIGQTSTEADRIRLYRAKIEEEKKQLEAPKDVQNQYKCTPEIELEKEIELKIEKEIDNKISWKDILVVWNDLPSPIKSIKAITDRRKDKIKARVNSLNLTIDDIIQAINNIKRSKFLQGQNGRQWIIDFDWLFKDDNRFSKVLEGQYNDKGGGPSGEIDRSAKELEESGNGFTI